MRQEFKDAIEGVDKGFELIKKAMRALAEDNARFDPSATMPVAHSPRDFSCDDPAALLELQRLSKPAKAFLEHHINNTINTVGLYCELNMPQKARECAWQLADILDQIMEVGHGHGAGGAAADAAAVSEAVEGPARGQDLATGA